MADVRAPTAGAAISVIGVNRYIFGDAEVGFASQIVVEFDLNGATATYNFQSRVAGATTWVDQIAYPFNSGTGTTSGSGTQGYQIDASGKEIAINVSAVATAFPILTWRPVVG